MPLVQGGPPQWVWERNADTLKWEINPRQDSGGHTVYELRINCGLEIVRLQLLTEDEIKELHSLIGEEIGSRA